MIAATTSIKAAAGRLASIALLEYRGALPLFSQRRFTVRITWSFPKSFGDFVCTASRWITTQSAEAWPCICSSFNKNWPRAENVRDGSWHVCAGQKEIPWPPGLEWARTWSCCTRMRPNGKQIQHLALSGFVALFASRGMQRSAAFQAAALWESCRIKQLACRNFRTADLLVESQNQDSAEVAGAFMRKLSVEARDHSTHSFLAACPSLALAAIQKT